MSAQDSTGFRDPDFVGLCELMAEIHSARRAPGRLATVVLRSVGTIRKGIRSIRRLPTLAIDLSGTVEGREIAGNLSGRGSLLLPRRVAVSVLEVPPDPQQYTRGRSRQAIRTNSRRAVNAGIICRPITSSEAGERVEDLLEERSERHLLEQVVRHARDGIGEFWLAEDGDGETVVLGLVTSDGKFARLDWMATAPREERSDARYLLSTRIIDSLAHRGIGHFGVESALLLTPGLRHFQQLLGFRPVNITISRSDLARAGSRSM